MPELGFGHQRGEDHGVLAESNGAQLPRLVAANGSVTAVARNVARVDEVVQRVVDHHPALAHVCRGGVVLVGDRAALIER